ATTSPEASSTASDSPTPTNSVHEKIWSSHWQSLVCEEQRELLGTEEESSDRQSDGEVEGDVWEITPEQREYYRTQFSSLQPDAAHGLLPGHIARAFFEKSRLPVSELRKIWQLSDVTKDGALSLEEFNTAMHLVVLRRNHIPVPDALPPSLIPSSPSSSSLSLQWTKFVNSPTSSISSPGPKPVNFDFHKSAVEQDPKILHPVAVRVTPGPDTDEPTSLTDVSPIRPIQRPQPKKHTAPGPGAIPPPPPQPPTEESVVISKKDPPPPPPPRPHRHHTRSSSLDLTRLGNGKSGNLNMPPVVPPRSSPGTVSPKKNSLTDKTDDIASGFANFAQFPDDSKQTVTPGAFQVYRKPGEVTIVYLSYRPKRTTEGYKILAREAHNAVLRRHCHQLQSTLASLQEEKATLQNILDHLMCH
ncbi:hypothetical protein AAG570_005908, partial [Ranatra chinensis]